MNNAVKRYIEPQERHQLRLSILVMICFLLITSTLAAQEPETKAEEKKVNPEGITLKERFGFRTNAADWLLTIPNVSVEFDLKDNIRNKHTVSAGLKYNWNTSHRISPARVLNILDARVEWRQYFRTRRRGAVTENPDILTRLKERVFTTKRANPRIDRAYFWGIYAHTANYSLKLGKEGKQGSAFGAGLSLGYTAPLYGYEKGFLDLEMGGSIGLIYTSYDVYTHDPESNIYAFDPTKSKGGHLVPFPVITDLRVAFVYRFMSVSDKYKASIERRIDRIMDKRNAANAIIQNMRVRIDSIDIAVRKQGGTGPDSLLTKEELKQWELMKKERKAKEQKDQEEKLRKEVAASLGIMLSDTLSSKQEKSIREEMDKRKKQMEETAKPADPKKIEKERKKAEKEAEKAAKKEEKKAKKEKKKDDEEAEKDKNAEKSEDPANKEAEAKKAEEVTEPEKKKEEEP